MAREKLHGEETRSAKQGLGKKKRSQAARRARWACMNGEPAFVGSISSWTGSAATVNCTAATSPRPSHGPACAPLLRPVCRLSVPEEQRDRSRRAAIGELLGVSCPAGHSLPL